MKPSIVILASTGFIALLVAGGCSKPGPAEVSAQAPSGQRVIKVSFKGQRESFRIRINRNSVVRFKNLDFTNLMTELKLDYGDIVVWEAQRDSRGRELSNPDGISSWWFNYLSQVRASFYSVDTDEVSDFFGAPILHWKARAEKPRALADTTFLVDGRDLGMGSAGFRGMINTIHLQKSGYAFILAPRIKNEGPASPWITGDQLFEWADAAGM